jgi:hypothetical protein
MEIHIKISGDTLVAIAEIVTTIATLILTFSH